MGTRDDDLPAGVMNISEPASELSASRFFADMVNVVTVHQSLKIRPHDFVETASLPMASLTMMRLTWAPTNSVATRVADGIRDQARIVAKFLASRWRPPFRWLLFSVV